MDLFYLGWAREYVEVIMSRLYWNAMFRCNSFRHDTMLLVAKANCRSVFLLCQRFWCIRCFCIAATNVVRTSNYQIHLFQSQTKWEKTLCILFLFLIKIMKSRRLPFDWKNPIGYFLAVALQYIVSTYIFFMAAGLTSFAIGIYLIGLAATKEIRNQIQEINKNLKTERDDDYIHRVFSIFTQWHSKLKQLSFHQLHLKYF